MALITDLPTELFLSIVDLLRITYPETLPALSLTCKRLHRPAYEGFAKNISLNWKLNKNSQVVKFVEGNHGSNIVQSIRLSPQKGLLNAFQIGLQSAYQHVNVICACLSSLPNLRTLSLYLGEVDRWCLMPTTVLVGLVKALPASVENLELDTKGIDRVWKNRPTAENSEPHLCHAISDILPRLITLRLRISCLCADISRSLDVAPNGTQPTSKLRLALVSLEIPDHDRLGQPAAVCDCRQPSNWERRRAYPGALSPKDLFDRFLRQQSHGAFPQLSRFILFSQSNEREQYMRVRDVATRTMTHFPFLSKPRDHHVYVILKIPGNTDCYGSYEDVEKGMLGEVAWVGGDLGVRIPPAVKDGSDVRDYCVDTTVLETSEHVKEEMKLQGWGQSVWQFETTQCYVRREE